MELDPTERIMAGVEEQSKEYSSKFLNNMGRILTNLTKIQHNNLQPQLQSEPDREPKVKKSFARTH